MEQDWITVECVRGVGVKERNGVFRYAKPGDTFEVPEKKIENGVYPLRWWEATGKAKVSTKKPAAKADAG